MEANLNYSVSEINRNFKIKVSGSVDGQKLNTLVGVSGLCNLLDNATDLINRLLDRAFRSKDDKCVCKLRRGIKVTFYYF